MKVFCDGCPCLNEDYEYGSHCNLGYDAAYERFKNGQWHDFSRNCQLEGIAYTTNGATVIFTPKRVPQGVEPMLLARQAPSPLDRAWHAEWINRYVKDMSDSALMRLLVDNDEFRREYMRPARIEIRRPPHLEVVK